MQTSGRKRGANEVKRLSAEQAEGVASINGQSTSIRSQMLLKQSEHRQHSAYEKPHFAENIAV